MYVDEIALNRDEYDLIAFVRDPVKRFVAVWNWMRNHTEIDFLYHTPENLDIHLRPQYLFEGVHDADYLGRFETIEKDWEILRERYLLGPFKKPDQIRLDPPWQEVITKSELVKVVNFYSRDFDIFGYEREAYLYATD